MAQLKIKLNKITNYKNADARWFNIINYLVDNKNDWKTHAEIQAMVPENIVKETSEYYNYCCNVYYYLKRNGGI